MSVAKARIARKEGQPAAEKARHAVKLLAVLVNGLDVEDVVEEDVGLRHALRRPLACSATKSAS